MNLLRNELHICNHRHSFALDNVARRLFQSPKKITSDYIRPGNTVIDIGCGPGFFTIPMAELVGETGQVIAVDLQPQMLAKLKKKLDGSILNERVELHQCEPSSLALKSEVKADFVLAYYMVHEVPNQRSLFEEVANTLSDDGQFLIVEPFFHVKKSAFMQYLSIAEDVGLKAIESPRKKGGMSVLLTK
ncbi:MULTISPECIES: class I SAM-dependent methyltransferase [unclassified Agarivorans]|uniref:class I SAM-dependent methyltransferase n=1 Tax=unclassified Agarivorans TaxID=2636026 RepID=UPI003D7C9B3A